MHLHSSPRRSGRGRPTGRLGVALVAFMIAAPLMAQPVGSLSGRVTDADNGQPIAAAQVTISGTPLGRPSSEDGRFSLTGVPAGTQIVVVRRIGYQQQSRAVTIRDGVALTVDFALVRSNVSLSGVVVSATGEERRKEVGNAVSTLSTAEFERGGVGNTQQILQGRATGVTVLANGGTPGAGGTIRLRGVNSITQGNRPIIYVDGIRIFNGNSPTGVSSRQSVSPLNDIPASDIERVEIVKGPAATTLYGTEASGGVIQIFTRRGREGPPVWTLEAGAGVNSMGDFGPRSDPTRMFLRQCRGPNMVDATGAPFVDATCPESGSWLQNGSLGRYSLGVRGASGGISYGVSGNFEDETGVIAYGRNRTGGVRVNLGLSPAKSITLGLNSAWQRRSTEMISDGNSADAFILNVSRGPGSNFRGGEACAGVTGVCVNNATVFTKDNIIGGDHFIVGGTATWTPVAQLSNRIAVGIDYNSTDQRTVNPFGYQRTPTGQYFQTLWNRTLVTVDAASTWKQSLGKHFSSSTSIGGQLFDSRLNSTDLQADNFSGPGTPTLVSGSLRQITDVNQQRVINAGAFAQQMIGWRDRLFVTLGTRIDGNSAFGRSFGLQNYPKVSVSYVLSDESFWPTWFETFKLRGALGEAGKAPGAFDATRTWNPIAAEGGLAAFTPGQLGNPNLGPERTRETEAGFDAGWLGGKVGLVMTWFNARTSDAIINVSYPPSQGFAANQPENVGVIENRGLEAQLSASAQPVSWARLDARLQYTRMKGSAVNLGGRVLTIDALSRSYVREGLPLPAYIGRRAANADKFEAPIIEEDQFLGATFPEQIINPTLTLTLFNDIAIEAIGEFQRGGHLVNANGFQNAGLGIWQPCFAAQTALRAAAAGNPAALANVTARDRLRCSINAAERDYSYWVESSDFFKLRSLSVSYEVPTRFVPGARAMTVQLTGRNLFVQTDYTGTDPEVADQRTSTFSRRDYYNFPPYRTFLFNVRTSF